MLNVIKKIVKKIPINFTKNQQYDSQTKKIIAEVCNTNSSCIDVGCHKGEVLDIFIKHAPNGNHFGFEPIPDMFKKLQKKYKGTKSKIFNIALSNSIGESSFNYVISNPAYSGLIKRNYDNKNEVDQQLIVETNLLDNIIPQNVKIDIIKIDVEGGELLVLEGAVNTIKNSKPIIIFEHGLGASEFYNSTPDKVFKLLSNCDMKISTMYNWLNKKPHFTLSEFKEQYDNKINYYFIAY